MFFAHKSKQTNLIEIHFFGLIYKFAYVGFIVVSKNKLSAK